jgi:hypothetical protein
LMAFPDAEFVHSDAAHFAKGDGGVLLLELFFMYLFDHVPADPQPASNRQDCGKLEQIKNELDKRADCPAIANHERESGPPDFSALTTFQTLHRQVEKTSFSGKGDHMETPHLSALGKSFSAATLRAPDELVSDLGIENDRIAAELSGFVVDTAYPVCMIKNRSGHGQNPPFGIGLSKDVLLSCPLLF